MKYLGFEIDQVPFCCGVMEMGNFDDRADVVDFMGNAVSARTHRGAARKALRLAFKDREKFAIQAWFKRPKRFDGSLEPKYEFDELRQVFKNHKRAIHLGCYINPNSGNEIDGYLIQPVECSK